MYKKQKFIDIIKIYVDGCCKGNPGPSAIGAIIIDEKDTILCEQGRYLGDSYTNNETEYHAIDWALDLAPDYCTRNIEVYSDSQHVIKQLNREYRIHKRSHLDINRSIRHKESTFKDVKYIKVPESNKYIRQAEKKANEILRKTLEGS